MVSKHQVLVSIGSVRLTTFSAYRLIDIEPYLRMIVLLYVRSLRSPPI